MHCICEYDNFFVQWHDYIGKFELSTIQKCIIVLQQLAYGIHVDSMDKYFKLGESTTSEHLNWFVHAIVAHFWPLYLRELI